MGISDGNGHLVVMVDVGAVECFGVAEKVKVGSLSNE
jgi:hypothetical protein